MSFFSELQRRHVYKVGAAYAVAGWLLVQAVTQVLPLFDISALVQRIIVLVVIAGFPVALVLAWVFDLTPAGIVRTDDQAEGEAPVRTQPQRSLDRKLNYLLGGLLLLGFAYIVAQRGGLIGADNAATEPSAAIGKSIAVLPFENLSADQDNAYFTTGMQDEILTRLAGIRDLKVISRTSTEQYASRPPNLRIVGQQLGVATVLEGSVQRVGGKVRINLQLIDAQTDSHLWAQNYDRDLADVFAVQSDVAEKVADALKAQLLPAESARLASVPTENIEAHDLYLKARYLFQTLQTGSARDPATSGQEAVALYRAAIAADPGFAVAHAQLSFLQSYLHWYSIDTSPAVVDEAQRNAERALALRPGLPEAHLAMGYVHYWGHRDYTAALREFGIARVGMPNNAEVLSAIGYVLRRQGDASFGIPELKQAELLDPQNSLLSKEIADSYAMPRRYDQADVAFLRSLAIFPGDTEAQVQRATVMIMRGDTAAAERLLAGLPADLDPEGSISRLRFRLQMLLRRPDAALAAIAGAPGWLMSRFEHSAVPVELLRGQALAFKGDADAARAAFLIAEKVLLPQLANPVTALDASSHLGLVYAGLSRKQAALSAARAASEGLPMSRDPMVGAYNLERTARVEAQVGESEAAIDHLIQLLQAPAGTVLSAAVLRIDPAWDALRQQPRFQKLLADPATKGEAKP